MDFKDYINGLNDLDNQEARTELKTFYTLNATTFKFFKVVDATLQDLFKQSNVSAIAKQQLEDILPILIRLRTTILELDSQSFAKEYSDKIQKSLHYIQNVMTANEVHEIAQSFFSLLEDNKKAYIIEQKNQEEEKRKKAMREVCQRRLEKENEITTVEEAEKFFLEIERLEGEAVYDCQIKTIILLAEKSTNSTILRAITDYLVDAEGIQSCDEEDLWESGEYEPYILMNCLYSNPKLPAYLRQRLDEESLHIKLEVAENSRTDLKTLTKLAYDSELYVSQVAKANPNYIKLNSNIPNTNKPTSKSGCFIATACYGDYDAPEVLILRRYRDEYLLTNWLGSLFVRFYYAVSPSIARCLEKSDMVKSFIRNYFLRPIVRQIQCKYSNKN